MLAVSTIIISSSSAFAKDGAFVQAFGGVTHMAKAIGASGSPADSAAIYGAGVGYNFNKISTSITIDTVTGENSHDRSQTFESTAILLNGFYNFSNSTKFTPFLGAGIGSTLSKKSKIPDTAVDYASSFVYEVQGGAKYAVSKHVSVLGSLSYRQYLKTGGTYKVTGGTYSGDQGALTEDERAGFEFFAAKVAVQYDF